MLPSMDKLDHPPESSTMVLREELLERVSLKLPAQSTNHYVKDMELIKS
jgi:hypothetical protein